MIGVKSSHYADRIPTLAFALLLCGSLACWPAAISAQSPEETAAPKDDAQTGTKTYIVENGNETYTRTEQSERRKTPDGEVETQRVVMSTGGGEDRILLEKEIRTKKMPNGDVEKEYILKNPSGDGRLVPVEITHETIKQSGGSTTVEREVTKPDFQGHWSTLRKERATETGPESARQTVKEVREPTLDGTWRVVDREVTATKSSKDSLESHSVRQIPDAQGQLADYEVRDERTTKQGGKETSQVAVHRRDFANTDQPKFYLVERSTSERSSSPDGKVVTHSTKESDALAGGASRNLDSGPPQLIEERTEEAIAGQDGSRQVVVRVKERDAADSQMRPSSAVITEKDARGNVRQIFIPAR
jgi:hypothetical protein